MDTGHTCIPNPIDNIAHRLCGQRCLFGDGYVARAGSYDCDRTDTLIGLVASNSDQTRRFVPLGVSNDVPNLTKRAFVGACDEDVRGALYESFNYADVLGASLAAAANDFQKALAPRACVVAASSPSA